MNGNQIYYFSIENEYFSIVYQYDPILFFFKKIIYLFLFSYNCLHFLPFPPPHPPILFFNQKHYNSIQELDSGDV